jgi:hypothetical protein
MKGACEAARNIAVVADGAEVDVTEIVGEAVGAGGTPGGGCTAPMTVRACSPTVVMIEVVARPTTVVTRVLLHDAALLRRGDRSA